MATAGLATFNWGVVLSFAIYLMGMFAIGYWAWRRTANSEDYFLGGRGLGPWPAALSAGASDMSGWLLLGLPGFAFLAGLEAVWLAIGLWTGTLLNWQFQAKRLRRLTQHFGNAITLPEYFNNRFDDKSRILQVVSAVFVLLFFLFYTSSGLVAGGKLFETVFGLPYQWAVVIGCVCVVGYTFFGGFLAVSWTDLVQGLLMAAALFVVPIVVYTFLSGEMSLMGELKAVNPELANPLTDVDGKALGAVALLSSLAWGLGYFGQPHILARFAAIRDEAAVPAARNIAVTWSGIAMVSSLAVGVIGMLYTQETGVVVEDSETIFILLVNIVFHPLVAGILLAAILAAIMSTADSQLLVCSSALTEDLYKVLRKGKATSEETMWLGRAAVIGIAVIATLLALSPGSSVLDLVSYAWAGFGAAFGPALLLSLYWSRMTCWGALAGIVIGGVTVVVWKQLSGGWFDLYELLPGFILATVAVVGVSLVTPCQKDLKIPSA